MQRRYPIVERPLSPRDYDMPVGWWGWNWEPPVPMSITQLLEAGNMDARTAALCGMTIESHGSMLIAAEQPHSGKTTTLTALLDFLPNATRRIFIRGWAETFDFLGQTKPEATLLLANELSSHLPVYLWGPKAVRVFESAPARLRARVDAARRLVRRGPGAARRRARCRPPRSRTRTSAHGHARVRDDRRRIRAPRRVRASARPARRNRRGAAAGHARRTRGLARARRVRRDRPHPLAPAERRPRRSCGRARAALRTSHRPTRAGCRAIPEVRAALASYRGEPVPNDIRGDPVE